MKRSETSVPAQQKRVIVQDKTNMAPASSLSAPVHSTPSTSSRSYSSRPLRQFIQHESQIRTEKKTEGQKVVTEKRKKLEKMVRELLNIKDREFDITRFFLSINTSACRTDPRVNSLFNLTHVEAVTNLLIHNYRTGAYKGNEILIATPETAQCTRYERAFSRVLDQLPIEYHPIVGMLDKIKETKARVLIFDVTTAAPRKQADHHIIYDMLEVAKLKTFDVRLDLCRLGSKTDRDNAENLYGQVGKANTQEMPQRPCFSGDYEPVSGCGIVRVERVNGIYLQYCLDGAYLLTRIY